MIVFDEEKHVYTNANTGEPYISVTTLLDKYKKPFDVEGISERVAKREGVSPEYVRELWQQQNEHSKEYGTLIHSIIEQYHKDNTITEGHEDMLSSYSNLNILSQDDEILSEHRVFSHKDKIAGTADIIRINKKNGFDIFDIKTNKKFNFFSEFNDYMLEPVSHLHACEYSAYSLQLSLYAYMYAMNSNRCVNRLGIFYYDRTSNSFTYIPVIYLETDIKNIIKHYEQS